MLCCIVKNVKNYTLIRYIEVISPSAFKDLTSYFCYIIMKYLWINLSMCLYRDSNISRTTVLRWRYMRRTH
jgi:hypothetical protein